MTTAKPRARKGTTTARVLLALPTALRDMSRAAARSQGITEAEWWRRAALLALGTQAAAMGPEDWSTASPARPDSQRRQR